MGARAARAPICVVGASGPGVVTKPRTAVEPHRLGRTDRPSKRPRRSYRGASSPMPSVRTGEITTAQVDAVGGVGADRLRTLAARMSGPRPEPARERRDDGWATLGSKPRLSPADLRPCAPRAPRGTASRSRRPASATKLPQDARSQALHLDERRERVRVWLDASPRRPHSMRSAPRTSTTSLARCGRPVSARSRSATTSARSGRSTAGLPTLGDAGLPRTLSRRSSCRACLRTPPSDSSQPTRPRRCSRTSSLATTRRSTARCISAQPRRNSAKASWIALGCADIDISARRIRVTRSHVLGAFDSPKSARSSRSVPISARLADALVGLLELFHR